MTNKFISDLEEQLDDIDIDSIKLDATIQLKTWRKKMYASIDKVYATRLKEIEEMVFNIENEIEEEQRKTDDHTTRFKLKSDIIINQTIPDHFHHLIEQTIRIEREGDQDNDDDLVIVNMDKNEEVVAVPTPTNSESRISKILNSDPVQQALAVTLVKTLTQTATLAATSATTLAATSMAKTALLTTAYGVGRIAMGTTKKVWSLVVSSDDL